MAWTDPIDTAVTGVVAPAAMWNEVRDNFALIGPHLVVRKPSDETVTSSTALQADNHLILPLAANEVWRVELVLYVTGDGLFKCRFTFPTSCSTVMDSVAVNAAGTLAQQTYWNTTSPGTTNDYTAANGSANVSGVRIGGLVINGANSGNLTLEWAQFNSTVGGTTVKTNSTLWGVKLA